MLGALTLFTSASLAAAIHRSYPKRHDEPSDIGQLYTEGPYALCRHPFYLLLILVQFSIPAYTLSLWGAIVCLAMLPLWMLLVRLEEKELIAYWGDRYREYMRRTPQLIPRPRIGRSKPQR